ncbi:kinase-like domain-containing protein [Tanacetum coccineum]
MLLPNINLHGRGEVADMKFIDSLRNCSRLVILDLYNCSLQGVLPRSIGNLSNQLYALELGENQLYGSLPSSVGNLAGLTFINLGANRFTGKLPDTIGMLQKLQFVRLSENQFSGPIPDAIGNLSLLITLYLNSNRLEGHIPSGLGNCKSLNELYLTSNKLNGKIPEQLLQLPSLSITLDLSQNSLSGSLPIEGEVPVLGVFANVTAFSVLGNSRLCGGQIELGLPKCKEAKKPKQHFPLFLVVILIASTLFTILCFVYAWCKKKSNDQPSQSSGSAGFLQVSYNQLLKATDGFSEANLIGVSGFSSVYKGILDAHDDRFVAVKVLHLQIQGAQRSFMRECEAWQSIRHRNLLKIITSCSGVDFQGSDFKALVYEFMPKGSLHDWLHSSANTSRLNLLQRMNILMDVACALDYLHNCCQTTIVHGDVKPSNILLDDDMVAHVGYFGLARYLGMDSNQNSSTGVKGIVGYAPPEYGLGSEMTVSGDVYSFGILLLEVMTGKKPTDDIFKEGLSLHKFASIAFPDHVIDAIDGDAIVLQSTEAKALKMEECLTSIVKIGVSCSVDSPTQRLNIENVVHELQHILDVLQNI